MSPEEWEPEHCTVCGAFMGQELFMLSEKDYPDVEMSRFVCNNPRCRGSQSKETK